MSETFTATHRYLCKDCIISVQGHDNFSIEFENGSTKLVTSDDVDLIKLSDIKGRIFRVLRTQQGLSQHELILPEKDAELVMAILKTNKYWCVDCTDSLSETAYQSLIKR